jgi:hypothetical protein
MWEAWMLTDIKTCLFGRKYLSNVSERESMTASIRGIQELGRCRELDRLLLNVLLMSPEVSAEMFNASVDTGEEHVATAVAAAGGKMRNQIT